MKDLSRKCYRLYKAPPMKSRNATWNNVMTIVTFIFHVMTFHYIVSILSFGRKKGVGVLKSSNPQAFLISFSWDLILIFFNIYFDIQDLSARIMTISQSSSRNICILTANGAISNVTLRQPASSGGTVTYEVYKRPSYFSFYPLLKTPIFKPKLYIPALRSVNYFVTVVNYAVGGAFLTNFIMHSIVLSNLVKTFLLIIFVFTP